MLLRSTYLHQKGACHGVDAASLWYAHNLIVTLSLRVLSLRGNRHIQDPCTEAHLKRELLVYLVTSTRVIYGGW